MVGPSRFAAVTRRWTAARAAANFRGRRVRASGKGDPRSTAGQGKPGKRAASLRLTHISNVGTTSAFAEPLSTLAQGMIPTRAPVAAIYPGHRAYR